jgi:hypothetical protein
MKGVQGSQAAQVRMFAHDARPVQLVTGSGTGAAAINSGTLISRGAGYTTASGGLNGFKYGVATSGGTGSGMTVDIQISGGEVVEVLIADGTSSSGTPYVEGETITIAGGTSSATFSCSKNLSNVSQRGACLYIGVKMASITVELESGARSVVFKGVNAGSFFPTLVTKVVTATADSGNISDNDIIALY